MSSFDIVIVGGGIAGLSLAAALHGRSVLVLEAEDQHGQHSSGRSAALFTRSYGNAIVRDLTVRSDAFFQAPPAGFADAALTAPRPCLYVASPGRLPELRRFVREVGTECPGIEIVERLDPNPWGVPLDPEVAGAGAVDRAAMDIDAHAFLTGFRNMAKRHGAVLSLSTRFLRAARSTAGWAITTSRGQLECRILVDAAGAWADEVAAEAGIRPVGLQPKRRTLACVEVERAVRADWPFVVDLDMTFYFKPDAGRLIISPADETLVPPGDAYAEEWDVAVAIDRIEKATGMKMTRLISSWAGLRTFMPDERPVVGVDPASPGFFWFAGQGGFGLQTAPALAALGASLLLRRQLNEQDEELAAALSPKRGSLPA